MIVFADRADAGRCLARELRTYRRQSDAVVLALPRGGAPVAYEVAARLELPLDVFLVRKLGAPDQEELAMGAIASGGARTLNMDIVRSLNMPDDVIDMIARRELAELERRERLYRGDRPPLDLHDKTAIIVDDGLATGASMRAAVTAIRKRGAARIVAAVPVAAQEACVGLEPLVDELICLETPDPFVAVGYWYEDFSQVGDEQVRALLAQAQKQGS